MLSSKLFTELASACRDLERRILVGLFGIRFPPIAAVELNSERDDQTDAPKFSIKDIIGDGFLYAVPKKRRSVEVRMNRKFGKPGVFWKPYVPKTNLRVCSTCGYHYEAGILCGHCYNENKNETIKMQAAIKEKLGLQPIEKEVVVLYEGEQVDEVENNKYIVKMDDVRPKWFGQNLLQKTTQKPATTTDVKPTELA